MLNKFGSLKEPFLFLISYDLKKTYIEKLQNLSQNIKFEIDSKNKKNIKDYSLKKYPISFIEYKKKFDLIQDEIKNGNSYLLNLTAQTKIDTNLTLDNIYEASSSLLKLRVKLDDLDFVCFSPEKFIDIKDNKIYTYPMKGTIDTNLTDAKNILLNNKKELAEHTMVVDLLRNDLGKVANNIKVEEFRTFSKIVTKDRELFQTSSIISADLQNNWQEKIGDILSNILPAGSITGTPKKSTIEILKNIEKYDRGFYSGIFGIFDGINLQSFVLIRFIENINNELFYKSGGGITSDSIAKEEYEELLNKVYLPF
ncbi:aminodeoxychorismate synthase component I [Aliarcobacter cryaerophilus]|uniref:aminodeoxychorismate synthase component I n=1 Tax=Aliarcobacter cryaerophilus TaxID=28198 RepID=UPI0021B68112|nr:aminodeoxychorismate synthase component I [Aliarcobacter cryaerophilus]MCT7465728.1 aminodeoxychorismate synthase component I [Aliarcobacter cryaerophilus]